jgi:hypothetical protein
MCLLILNSVVHEAHFVLYSIRNYFNGVIDHTETISEFRFQLPEFVLQNFAYKIRKLWNNSKIACFIKGQWPYWNDFSGVVDPAETILARSLNLPKRFQRGHWPHWNDFSGVIDLAEIHMAPSTFQIVVWARNFFLREYPAKLFHREISPYHISTLTKKKLGNSRLNSAGSLTPLKPILTTFEAIISANTKPYAKRL